jgi:cell division septation protein DedD
MRTFIILLLLANIAYFGWNQGWLRELPPAAPKVSVPAQFQSAQSPFEPAARTLTLVAELTESELAALALAAAPAPVTPPVSAPAQANLAPVVAEPLVEPEQNQAVALPPPAVASPPWCGVLGEFESPEAAAALIPALAALDVEAGVRTKAVPVGSTFWVYMPAFASEAEARDMLRQLQERKIDSYYMRSGQFPGGISLGVFSRRASAESVQATMASQGYRTTIGEVLREEPRSTLVLHAADGSVVKRVGWADFVAKNTTLTVTENVCESVASPNQFP